MRYEDIRAEVQSHFKSFLAEFQAGIAQSGQLNERGLQTLVGSLGLSDSDPESWAAATCQNGSEGLLRAFTGARDLSLDDLTPEQRDLLLSELNKGYRAYLTAAIAHNDSFDEFNLGNEENLEQSSAQPSTDPQKKQNATPYLNVVEQYFIELDRADTLAAKTRSEKQDALKLLGEITIHKPVSELDKADARKVKDTLLRIPKNRSKSAKTRDLELREMLKLTGGAVISARTVNAYIMSTAAEVPASGAEQKSATGCRALGRDALK